MSVNTNTNIKTVVRFVYILVIALTLVYATAYAQSTPPSSKPVANSATPSPAPNGQVPLWPPIVDSPQRICHEQEGKVEDARRKVSQSCGQPTECAKKMKACIGTPKTSTDTSDVFAKLLGKEVSEVRQNCNDTPSGYESKRKSFQEKIETLGKDIKGLEKDDTDIDEKYQEKVVKLQETFAKEQKDLDTLQEDIDSKNMEEEKNALDEDQKAAANLSKLMEGKMQLRNDLSTATVKAQSAMIEASEEISRGDCIAQVKKFKKEMKDANSTRANSAGDLIGGGNTLRRQLETRFNACMEIMTMRRKEIGRELSEKVAAISFKMDENARQIQELEDYSKKSAEQRAKRAQLMVDKKQKAIKASVQKTQQIQGQLAQEGELAKKKHASIQKAIVETSSIRNRVNGELIGLGAMDPATSANNDASLKSATGDWIDFANLASDYSDNELCCPKVDGGPEPKGLCAQGRTPDVQKAKKKYDGGK